MADVSDVCNVLVGIASGVLYPNGTGAPSIIAGVSGIRVYVGWPVPDQLDADIANLSGTTPAPICHVAVYPLPAERNTTRYLQKWTKASCNTPTLTLTAAGQTVTVAGAIPPISNPHNVCVFANGIPYIYAVQLADTLASTAAALATLISVGVPGTSSAGAIITLPDGSRLGPVRVGVTGTSILETARQEKQIQISVFADSPLHRTEIAKAIDPVLKKMTFIALPDLTAGRIRYFGNREFDTAQKQAIYQRNLIFTVEYATIETQINPQILAIGVAVQTPAQQTVNTFYQ